MVWHCSDNKYLCAIVHPAASSNIGKFIEIKSTIQWMIIIHWMDDFTVKISQGSTEVRCGNLIFKYKTHAELQ